MRGSDETTIKHLFKSVKFASWPGRSYANLYDQASHFVILVSHAFVSSFSREGRFIRLGTFGTAMAHSGS